jgi:hypothetical protein
MGTRMWRGVLTSVPELLGAFSSSATGAGDGEPALATRKALGLRLLGGVILATGEE